MHWTLHLAREPVNDAVFMEFAEAFQASKGLANLVIFHTNGALGDVAIAAEAVLLGGGEFHHAGCGRRRRRRRRALARRVVVALSRRSPVALDAVAHVSLARLQRLLVTERGESPPTNGAEIVLRDRDSRALRNTWRGRRLALGGHAREGSGPARASWLRLRLLIVGEQLPVMPVARTIASSAAGVFEWPGFFIL